MITPPFLKCGMIAFVKKNMAKMFVRNVRSSWRSVIFVMLFCGCCSAALFYQDIDPTQFPLRLRHGRATKIFSPDIAGDQNAVATLGFDQPLGLASVFVLIEI